MGVYIPGMEMPMLRPKLAWIYPNGKVIPVEDDCDPNRTLKAIPVPDHGDLLKVLKTERECVSRDCDRDCGKCDLALERQEILSVYDALIAMLADPAKEEKHEKHGRSG